MAERRKIAPYDEITGVTCAIATSGEILDKNSDEADDHHTNHQQKRPKIVTLPLQAIRTLRLQTIPVEIHNKGPKGYHWLYSHSKLSESLLGKSRMILCTLPGAIPGRVIDIEQGRVRPIGTEERQRLFYGPEIRPQSKTAARKFLIAFVLEQAREEIEADMSMFRRAKNLEDKSAIADDVLERFIPGVFEPINERYQMARFNGTLPEDAPSTAVASASNLIFEERRRVNMFDDLVFNEGRNIWKPIVPEDPFDRSLAA